MSENIVLALVGFGLGILTTIFSQLFIRWFKNKDTRHAHQLKQLQIIREWMEAERNLFCVKYPDLFEFVFCHKALVPNAPFFDKKSPEILYTAMKEYVEAKKKVEDAKRKGDIALHSLDNEWFYKIPFIGSRALIGRQFGEYPTGFPRKLNSHLSLLKQQEIKVFTEFPGKVTRGIHWDRLQFIEPLELPTIIEPRINYHGMPQIPDEDSKEIALGNLRDEVSRMKIDAEKEINSVLEIVAEYEKKWL
jgi:hypothetical protein